MWFKSVLRFEVVMAANVTTNIFGSVTPCSLTGRYQCCLSSQYCTVMINDTDYNGELNIKIDTSVLGEHPASIFWLAEAAG
jgi:hypothetical protein